jgi:predicted nucleotidyltransferase
MPVTGSFSFEDVRAYAEASEDVLGVILFGSRGRDFGIDERSDWDLVLVATDAETARAAQERFPSRHGSTVEVFVETLPSLEAAGELDGPDEWRRYLYAHLTPIVDRTGGELQRVLDAKELLPPELRERRAAEAVDAFVNAVYRARRYGTRLDAAEAAPLLLSAAFALGGRIRPYNKYLAWELERHPLAGWPADETPGLLDGLLAGDEAALIEAFGRIAQQARAAGLGGVIDGWEPDVSWLRGESAFRS